MSDSHAGDPPAGDPRDPANGFAQRGDAMLRARAQAGDMQAFATLYACFGRACFNLALRILGNRTQAEDLVQEVFVKLFAAIRSYRGEAPFGSWLKRLPVNATIDQQRSQRHDSGIDAHELAGTQVAPDSGQAAATLDAWTLLQRLSPRARAVLELHE